MVTVGVPPDEEGLVGLLSPSHAPSIAARPMVMIADPTQSVAFVYICSPSTPRRHHDNSVDEKAGRYHRDMHE